MQNRALARERIEAPFLLAELALLDRDQRRLALASSPRLHNWGVYELLLERSWKLVTVDRGESEELARLAIDLSFNLDVAYYGSEMIEDLRSRAWSYIGNLRRISMDLESAEQAFRTAFIHLRRGSGDPIERALYLDLKASLRGSGQCRYSEAKRLLERAIEIFVEHGDNHRAGKSLVSLAMVSTYAGQVGEAVLILEKALALIDPDLDERLVLTAWHNLTDDLAMLGRFRQAASLHRRTAHLYRRNQDRVLDLQRIWTEAKIEQGLGHPEASEALYLQARDGFLSDGMADNAALVSLELATVYAEQDRPAESRQLASVGLAIFRSRQIPREALAAVILLVKASRRTMTTA